MGNSAPVPPDEGDAPEGEDLDEPEMTSIMDAEQRRELQRAARSAKEPERETARPPPEAMIAEEVARGAEVVIPRAAAVPTEALRAPAPAAVAATAPAPEDRQTPSTSWFVVAFVLLAAAVAFELR